MPPTPALRCVTCGVVFGGRYLRNWWGDTYCDTHRTCDSCRRPLPDGPGHLCDRCRYEAVTMRDEAVRALLRVNGWMGGLGLGLPVNDVPLRFLEVSRPALASHPAHTLTQELRRTSPLGRRTVERTITGVEVVRGLTRVHVSSLLAHELTHAWLFLEHVDLGDPQLEEGAAELVRSFWLRAHPEPESAYWLEAMEQNRDPVYGDGFRRVRARYAGEPLPEFLRGLSSSGPGPVPGRPGPRRPRPRRPT